ncbi:hypothetical protein [Nocardia sp. CC227C]|uniref:hypothetical protein n=1 Tax=Nocardia sp. CC227C TaxID=3044562 RepID=UPI00278BFE3A|nr:hypothetical protein [Nocardia sp. CC227C]
MSAFGEALLLNPERVDPWNHFILDSANGMISPRYVGPGFDIFGEKTLEVLECINYEAVTEGRRRVLRRYYDAVDAVLSGTSPTFAMIKVVREAKEDDFGLSSWFAAHEGADEKQFKELKIRFPRQWRTFQRISARWA